MVNIFGFPFAFVPSANTSTVGILLLVQDPESQHGKVPIQPPYLFTCAPAVSHDQRDTTVQILHPFLSFQLKERSLFEGAGVVFFFLVSFPLFLFLSLPHVSVLCKLS